MKSNTELARLVFNDSRKRFYEFWEKMSEEEALKGIHEAREKSKSDVYSGDYFAVVEDECLAFYRNKLYTAERNGDI